MVFEVEEQLEFEFMKEKPKQKQERYYEYMKRMYREAEEKDANLQLSK
jgi:hypothetical protein